MEEYITRTEFEHQIAQLREEMRHRQTDEIPAVNVNVGSQDVLDRLDELKQELHTVSNTWLNTLQEHYTEHKEAISDLKTVQNGHAKYFEEHGKRLAATATKDDVSRLEGRIDTTATKEDIKAAATKGDLVRLESDITELKSMMKQLLQQKSGNE